MIHLTDINPEVVDAWHEEFDGRDDVKVKRGSIFKDNPRTIVCPGNSFGWMRGGFDDIVRQEYGNQVESRIQEGIVSELFVGKSMRISVYENTILYAPTMRTPQCIRGTLNVYYCFGSVLGWNITDFHCPGLGTGIGHMDPKVSAKQMRAAYDMWKNPRILTFGEAKEMEEALT